MSLNLGPHQPLPGSRPLQRDPLNPRITLSKPTIYPSRTQRNPRHGMFRPVSLVSFPRAHSEKARRGRTRRSADRRSCQAPPQLQVGPPRLMATPRRPRLVCGCDVEAVRTLAAAPALRRANSRRLRRCAPSRRGRGGVRWRRGGVVTLRRRWIGADCLCLLPSAGLVTPRLPSPVSLQFPSP